MITCPNCKKTLADGTKFCTACGTNLEQVAPVVEETPVVAVTPVAEAVQVEAKKPALDVSKIVGTLKAVPKKMWAIGGGIILVAVVAIVAVVVLLGMAPKDKYVVYLKDGELYINMMDGKESIELTQKFASGDDVSKDSMEVIYARHYVRVSEDGKTVFYPEKWDADSYEFDLYYRSTTDGNAEGERIAKNVSGYTISSDGKNVFYMSDGTLYKHNLKEETEIEDDISGFWVSEDGKMMLYLDSDYDLYQWKNGKDAEKIAKGIELLHISTDLTKVFYKDVDGDLYLWTDGVEEAEKVDENVTQFITGYDNGGAYYTKIQSTTTTMADYIVDDYAASDAVMEKPVYPSTSDYWWPTAPEYPYYWDFEEEDDYLAAYAQYQIDYEKYLEDKAQVDARYDADVSQYYVDYEAWSEKSDRDYYRQYFDSYEYTVANASLYYYDGETSQLVVDNMDANALNSHNYTYLSNSQAPVIAFYASQAGESVKINISEITSLSTTNRLIKESLESSVQFVVASGAESKIIESGLVNNIHIGLDGKHVYYSLNTESENSVLYEVSTDGTVSEAIEYDSEVGYVWGSLSNGKLVYFKDYDYDDAEGTLYIAKEKIEKDVYDMIVEVNGGEAIYLWKDSNGDEGMLCYYAGKEVEEIQDDASVLDYATTKEGAIIYLVDYSHSKEEGELYYSVNGKEGKAIDEDVITIISPYGQ